MYATQIYRQAIGRAFGSCSVIPNEADTTYYLIGQVHTIPGSTKVPTQ